MESRLLGFPCFPYSVISMACFGNARFHQVTITAKARFGNRNHLSEMAIILDRFIQIPPPVTTLRGPPREDLLHAGHALTCVHSRHKRLCIHCGFKRSWSSRICRTRSLVEPVPFLGLLVIIGF